MKRKEFIKKTFQCGFITCLGLQFLPGTKLFASFAGFTGNANREYDDEFLKYFSWITNALNVDMSVFFEPDSANYQIISEFKAGWAKQDTVKLLTGLSDKYGDKAYETVELFIKKNVLNDWPKIGEKEAKEGSEVEDFLRVLWENLPQMGFEFTQKKNDNIYAFSVTKCPIAELAKKTNMHKWLYHMSCIGDFYTTPSFSKEIGFSRTKTLIQSDDECNHTYYYKSKVTTKDSLLGYCGLYCGACPANQSTVACKPINYEKKNEYESCEGCNSKVNAEWCSKCSIKDCNRSKSIRVCLDCDDFPCEKITAFINDEKYFYHKEVEDKMKLYKEKGLDEWIKIQEKSFHCKKCGTLFNFFQKTCENCGADL